MGLLYELQVVSFFFLLFVLFLSNISVVNSQHHHHDHVCDSKQNFALLQFKNAFPQRSPYQPFMCGYYRPSTWNESTDCCSWDGVECDKEGQGYVVGLHLACSFLMGTLHPNNTLFTLSHLQTLNISSNDFSESPFSPQFGMLTNLRVLDLSNSFFYGDIPLEISHLSKLVSLHLSYNHLRFSNVVMNQLIHNLTNLKDFGLVRTNLSDIKPTCFMNFSLSLASLDLSSSHLSGNFPDHILGFPNLRVLQFSFNFELNGYLPMSNWSQSLEILELSETNFSGGIPISIGEAKALRYLDLSSCNFNGEIPESIGNLTQPPHFQIHSNPSMGSVPNCVFNLTQQASSHSFANLIHVDLSRNSFTGAIPFWLYSLPNLKYLFLHDNHFSGFMRDFRSNSLESLDLSNNNLQGEISESTYTQVNLTDLKLGSNNLSGVLNMDMLRIPSLSWLDVSNNNQLSIFSTTVISPANLVSVDMSSIKLEKVPYFFRNQKNLQMLDLSKNQIVGKISEWISELGGLSELDLSHNFLSSGIEVLLTMPNLMHVNLDFNLFNKLPVPILLPSMMRYFSVSNNEVSGNVHPSICQATNLAYLDLSNNSFNGALPSCLSNMTNLKVLILKSNNFSGVIPIPPSISLYIASENQFIGEIPLSICLSRNLQILSVSNNRMSGTIPPCLTNITSLSVLNLKNNNFRGTFPTFFSTTCQLRSLDLNDNQIEGELPQSLLNCEYLQVLDLGNNNITGYFPYWLEFSSSLRILILRSNQFYGHINNSFNKDGFSNLRIIDLSHNNFSGTLPSNFFKNMRAFKEVEENRKSNSLFENELVTYYQDSIVISSKGLEQKFERILLILKTIDLSSNDFNGEIPKEIGMLRSLVGLNLSHNKLTGGIPTSLSKLKNLEWLDLSSNQLLGSIPNQLVDLTFLSCLNLSQNRLSGPIPKGKQFETFENSSYFGNLGLCGNPLPKCDADQNDHKSQLLHEEEEDDSLEKGIWDVKAVFIGYGCGMAFGIFIGYLVFKCGKPMWIVARVEGRRAQKIQTSRKSCRPRKRNEH